MLQDKRRTGGEMLQDIRRAGGGIVQEDRRGEGVNCLQEWYAV
jgi:hypothetical protein